MNIGELKLKLLIEINLTVPLKCVINGIYNFLK